MQKKTSVLWLGLLAFGASLLSALLYRFGPSDAGFFRPEWQVAYVDQADYRYVAEHFWGIPHDGATYSSDFNGAWGEFLDQVPFRDIAIGTIYLAVSAIVGDHVSAVLPWLLITAWCMAYVILFFAVQHRFGRTMGMLCLGALILPVGSWSMTQELLTEGFLRPLFVVLVAALLFLDREGKNLHWVAPLALAIVLLLAHVKIQWMLLGFLLGGSFLCFAVLIKRYREIFPIVLATACIPLSLLLVHGIGWGMDRVVVGSGLHALWISKGEILTEACNKGKFKEQVSNFCITGRTDYENWGQLMAYERAGTNYAVLMESVDRRVGPYVLAHPLLAIERFSQGFLAARNFPDVQEFPVMLRLLDILTVLVLIAGCFAAKTMMVSAFGLGLWLIPAIANIVALYDPRYHRPMEGLPVICAVLVITMLWRREIVVRLATRLREFFQEAEEEIAWGN